MKQPELGKKIAELREARRLTQEELVERCNVSIRTIQRIEAGEVSPRSYTLKTILAALEYELDELSADSTDTTPKGIDQLKSFFLIDGGGLSASYLIRNLHLAWLFGIGYFVLRFFEGMAEFSSLLEGDAFSDRTFILIKLGILTTLIFFQRGFILLGALHKKELLKIASLVLLGISLLVIGADITSFYFDFISTELLILLYAIAIGAGRFIFGCALFQLPRSVGRMPRLAGAIELIAAVFSLTVALSFLSPLILIPAELLEIIILYRATERLQQQAEAGSIHASGREQMSAG